MMQQPSRTTVTPRPQASGRRELRRDGESAAPQRGGSGMARVLERNIEALLARRQQEDDDLRWQERVAERVTRFTGSMTFVWLHLVVYGAWILVNLGRVPGVPRFDPTFVVLAMVASVEAIFLSTFILITQNRMMTVADRRADLNLQISLLAEHEVTRLIRTTTLIAQHLGIEEALADPELAELAEDVKPEEVLATLERRQHQIEQRR